MAPFRGRGGQNIQQMYENGHPDFALVLLFVCIEVECGKVQFSFHVPSLVMISNVYQTVSSFLLVGPSYIKYAAFLSSFLFQSYCSPYRADQRCEHSGQAPSSPSWSGARVTREHELGELRWRSH